MSNIQTGAERMPHDLSYLGSLAGQIYPLSLHDALPILAPAIESTCPLKVFPYVSTFTSAFCPGFMFLRDQKSTRLNSSHPSISYAVFCLKKKRTSHPVTASSLPG